MSIKWIIISFFLVVLAVMSAYSIGTHQADKKLQLATEQIVARSTLAEYILGPLSDEDHSLLLAIRSPKPLEIKDMEGKAVVVVDDEEYHVLVRTVILTDYYY